MVSAQAPRAVESGLLGSVQKGELQQLVGAELGASCNLGKNKTLGNQILTSLYYQSTQF